MLTSGKKIHHQSSLPFSLAKSINIIIPVIFCRKYMGSSLMLLLLDNYILFLHPILPYIPMKINSIQYLRAIAVILVVYCHSIDFQMLFGISGQQKFRYLQNFGAIGVDIFFIISGFIIAYVSFEMSGKEACLLFLRKRFARINPPYYLITIIAIIIFPMTIKDYVFSWKETLNTFSIIPLFDHEKEYQFPILPIGWTLAFEWLFYIMFSTLILFKIKRRELALIIGIFGLSMLSFLPHKSILFTFITNPIIWEFGTGVIIAWCYKKYNLKKEWAITLVIAGILNYIILIYCGYSDVSESHFITSGKLSWLRDLLWGAPSVMLVIGLLYTEKTGIAAFKNPKWLLLGDASYSIYLTHILSLHLISTFMYRMPVVYKHIHMDLLVFILWAIAILVGLLFYWFVEKKLNNFFNSLLIKRILFKRKVINCS